MAGVQRDPLVAVVIPCWNHGAFLPEAAASARDQVYSHVECVIVDDGSTDPNTREVLENMRRTGFPVIAQARQGLAAARNTGVRATKAPYFVPLDADDRLAPDFISRLLPALLENPSLGYCYSHVSFFGAAAGLWKCPGYHPRKLLIENLSAATAVIRRSAFDRVGGYSPDMIHGFEDWDFWLALLSAGYHGKCVPQPLFFYRKHPPGRSMLDETQRHRAAMVHRMIEHHRDLFASLLKVSTADIHAAVRSGHGPEGARPEPIPRADAADVGNSVDEHLYQAWLAQTELDYIENSRSWRLVQGIKRNRLCRLPACVRFGPQPEGADSDEPPGERLRRIKASRSYRFIQALKRTRFYEAYARRKYGPQFAGASGSNDRRRHR